jgi:2',3'-cyclic-nucleotide 2'-phosphodiesterase (5'-nucleotidase family)
MWTGPAISTWFQGESMVEVMNEMEYDVATIGNHEFDFKIDGLNRNIELLKFPLIAANIRTKSTHEIPSFTQPYIIEEADGVKVAFIGLASQSTPSTTFPAFVADYDFISYDDAIVEFVPIVKDLGAEVIIVVGHIGENEMIQLAPVANSLGVTLITGGHTHRYVNKNVNGVSLIEVGSNMKSYGKVVIEYDKTLKTATVLSSEITTNTPTTVISNSVQTIVEKWQVKAEEDLAEVIGYCSEGIYRNTPALENMVADSWLFAYPEADISMTNAGGIRQDIMPGNITLASIVGLLPFTNTLYEVNLTGKQVIECVGNLVIGGMTTVGGYFLADGSPIDINKVYSVLTTDYLYSQPNSKFAQYDLQPYNTSISYMQPTVDWILSKNTNAQNPINNFLDHTARH